MRRVILIGAAVLSWSACEGLTTPGEGGDSYTPTWITASWNTGSTILSDRTDRDAVNHFDAICRASSLSIRPQSDRVAFIWTCTQRTLMYGCATAGQSAQPSFGFPPCAQDALRTPPSQLRGVYLENDGLGVVVPANGLRSIQLFYCGSSSTPSGTPMSCK